MKRKRYTEEQIISILKEHEAGASVPDLSRRHGMTENTIYRWKSKFGGMEVSEAKRLRELEQENAKLKRLLAEAELDTSVFLVPGNRVKNGEDRVIVLNTVAQSAVDEVRDQHPRYVFTYRGNRVGHIYNTAWKRARRAAGLPHLRVHDLKHTFGRRLRASGVSHETRKVLLGHKNGDITTHYSAPEIAELIAAAERVARNDVRNMPELTLLHVRARGVSA